MRPILFSLAVLAAAAGAARAAAAAQAVPPSAAGGLTETEQRRMEALYGAGWQYRTAVPPRGSLSNDPPAADLSQLDGRIKSDDAIITRKANLTELLGLQ